MICYGNIEEIILPILKDKPRTRDNDDILYIEYCRAINPTYLGLRFEDALEYRSRFDVASIASVSRARRKLQNKYEDLRASKPAIEDRFAKFKETIEYAGQ